MLELLINWSIFGRQICYVGSSFEMFSHFISLNEKHSRDCPLTITDLELHFNYYFDNNLVFKQFLVLNTVWYVEPEYQETKMFPASWYWDWLTSDWSPAVIWPVIYIIVWYLQCQLITWSDYLSGRTIPDLISSKTLARGSTTRCPGRSLHHPEGGGWCRHW